MGMLENLSLPFEGREGAKKMGWGITASTPPQKQIYTILKLFDARSRCLAYQNIQDE